MYFSGRNTNRLQHPSCPGKVYHPFINHIKSNFKFDSVESIHSTYLYLRGGVTTKLKISRQCPSLGGGGIHLLKISQFQFGNFGNPEGGVTFKETS